MVKYRSLSLAVKWNGLRFVDSHMWTDAISNEIWIFTLLQFECSCIMSALCTLLPKCNELPTVILNWWRKSLLTLIISRCSLWCNKCCLIDNSVRMLTLRPNGRCMFNVFGKRLAARNLFIRSIASRMWIFVFCWAAIVVILFATVSLMIVVWLVALLCFVSVKRWAFNVCSYVCSFCFYSRVNLKESSAHTFVHCHHHRLHLLHLLHLLCQRFRPMLDDVHYFVLSYEPSL